MTCEFDMSKKLRVAAENLSSGIHWLSPRATHYVCRVHRRPLGDELTLFDAERGVEARAVLLSLEGARAKVEVGPVRAASHLGMPWLTLVQGLGKGEKMDRIVREAATLGVARLVFVEGKHSVAKAQRAASKRERFTRIVTEALRQCGRGDAMTLVGPTTASELLDALDAPVRWVLQPSSEALPLLDALERLRADSAQPASEPAPHLQLWVGPEGGFSDLELERLQQRSATLVRLGPLVQRMETAAMAVVSAIGAWADARGCWRTGPFPNSLLG